eukprot:CAMPEP_0176405486 /NCGR_PEP_ID=MMETSP0127-20121128/360_1 /TAXON_ID=938130 /ORGANISM="Platyophrya macrostoma, Strain WH" /LENGTH=571 /DNA_ID=CAMNT_0017784541 /DNA_START=311 /DNA_END=2026 /DNA_ORIENTATION=-
MKLLSADGTYGFSLSKNGITYEFTTKNENVLGPWVKSLKTICILCTFHEEYKAVKMIGRGSFAKVYLVESKNTGKTFAVKAFTKESIIISNKANAKPSMINEIDIMRATNHENIIQLYEVYESEKSIYLVLELIQGKSLQEVLKRPNFREIYSEVRCINIIRSLLDALAYLATQDIMHRDLKPENILLENKGEKLKIVDFGLATFISVDDYLFKKCGTPGYIAPEVFKYDPKKPETAYNDRCDVFAIGCILFYMVFGYPFFDGSNASEILRMNRKVTNEFEALARLDQELANPETKFNRAALDLLKKLLALDQNQRPTAAQALTHPYFTPRPSPIKTNKPMTIDAFDKLDTSNSSPLLLKTSNSEGKPKERYEQKDSLYLDVGGPPLNGKVDTLNSGVNSNNNSLLLGQPVGSDPSSNTSSMSKFSGGGLTVKKELSKGRFGGNNLLKAAIFKNAEKNNPNFEDESPRRFANLNNVGLNSRFAGQSDFSSTGDRSSEGDGSPMNLESQSPTAQFTQSVEKIPLSFASGKKYNLIDARASNGNSPGLISPNFYSPTLQSKNLARFEESKTPY